jgi:hypothetical protein
MIVVYATALLILVASLLLGRALLTLLGERRPTWLAAGVGFAALVVACPILVRLPGRATTATIILALLLIAAALIVRRTGWVGEGEIEGAAPGRAPTRPPQHGREVGAMHGRRAAAVGALAGAAPHATAIAVVALTIAAASLPFLFNDQVGVLGEGIYTNDHAAQLYWADWLQDGFGPQPSAVKVGYPTGPQAVAVIAAEATGANLVDAFNGLLLAIPALTALVALAALGGLPPGRRTLVACLTALPYLAASFLAQSAFKETAMAMLLLAFAVCLGMLASHVDPDSRGQRTTGRAAGVSRRAVAVAVALLAAASVFTFSLPGLAWFVIALPVWLALEVAAGRRPLELGGVRDAIARHRAIAIAVAVVLVAVAVAVAGPAANFVDRINEVQESAGRLSSPVFPGEALGVWPEGDFRLVRGDVSGAIPATLLGLVAAGLGALVLIRRRDNALLAALVAAVAVYLGARLVASIHVEAKALAVMAPLVMLVALRALLAPGGGGETRRVTLARYALGAGFVVAALASTFLALRAAPVGFDDRASGLERLGERIQGESVAFLGVDRFGAYRLRGTLIRSPGGYVPPEVAARSDKRWQQGKAMDFDTLASYKLDQFDYAITTAAAYQSSPPPNMTLVAQEGDYVLWGRGDETPRNRILDGEDGGPGNPGAVLDCAIEGGPSERDGEATVRQQPVLAAPEGWTGPERVSDAAGGQENAFVAPAAATQLIELEPGTWELSLQYHSQVPLKVGVLEEHSVLSPVELPASLDGMYLTSAGRGAFWPAGEVEVEPGDGPLTIQVFATEPTGLQDALGVERRVWLGNLAATPVADPQQAPIADACGSYVDRFTLSRPGKSG